MSNSMPTLLLYFWKLWFYKTSIKQWVSWNLYSNATHYLSPVYCLVTSYDTVTKLTVMDYFLSHHSILTRTNKYEVNNFLCHCQDFFLFSYVQMQCICMSMLWYCDQFWLICPTVFLMFSINTLFGLHWYNLHMINALPPDDKFVKWSCFNLV
jgi:hypothetical protein